ncbi:MAG: FIST C-terminal domain-containing protein [Elusimicrobia bacterium]|nr:FIST C-terminal domain-containing protein [Elusimicrobiota bacterium]
MRIEQRSWEAHGKWTEPQAGSAGHSAQLVLIFGGPEALKAKGALEAARKLYPRALFLGCSTAGEILGTRVLDDSIASTAIRFDQGEARGSQVDIAGSANSFEAGRRLASSIPKDGLVHVFVLSDGTQVNGSELVRGMTSVLPPGVALTGGLSGDGTRFKETLVLLDGEPKPGRIAAIGLYGRRLAVGYGCLGGWDPFGPERLVTRSKGNVLYELDGRPALKLYKEYLGAQAAGLPSTGLLFPLNVRVGESSTRLVRTILAVSDADQSMKFAGDVPEGSFAQLMKANFDRLVDGAQGAAKLSHKAPDSRPPDLAILISCVGRKLVLKQRTEEELEAVREVLGPSAALTGFYSYGEICPAAPDADCELHNQTMTITTISER